MAELDRSFESDLREAVMDEAEDQLYARRNNLAFQFRQLVSDNIEDFATEEGYDLDSIAESGRVTSTSRAQNTVSATLEWDPPAAIFEFGARPHKIEGNPVLSFVWEDPPEWVKQEFPQGRDAGGRFKSGWRVFFPSVNHPGVPAGRFIRGALNQLRFQSQGGRVEL